MKRIRAHLTGSLQASISAYRKNAGTLRSTTRKAGGKSLHIGTGGNDMTIDEVEKIYKAITNEGTPCPRYCMLPCDKCVQECKQIVEWLEELKAYKQKPEGWMWGEAEQRGYNKAIDDVGKALLNEIYSQNIKMIIYGDGIDTLDTQIFPYKLWDNIAEQLKAGGKNE